MAFTTLRVDGEEGALRITLNRPDVLTALSPQLLDELGEVLAREAADPAVRAVLLTGSGRGFCSGADLATTSLDGDIGVVLEQRYHPVARALVSLEKPVVAGVNGVAAGAGMSLALACDLRLLSRAASFAVGFSTRGLAMDASCSYFLPRLVGLGRAFELAYSGRRVGAEEAHGLGLGEVLLEADDFERTAWDYVRRLATGPTLGYALVKRELRASLTSDLETQLALEARMQARAAASEDVAEGVRAFREKRPPRFRGR
jgi:2-(1,2-epoxy-1,2-dihydrophenyl)acetyl-CoA isomerase